MNPDGLRTEQTGLYGSHTGERRESSPVAARIGSDQGPISEPRCLLEQLKPGRTPRWFRVPDPLMSQSPGHLSIMTLTVVTVKESDSGDRHHSSEIVVS